MGKALIIAEKPSVASDIAKALGGVAKDKSGDFFEGEKYIISSAVGHLLELAVPAEHDVKRGKWTFAALPHIPPAFTLRPIERNENRLKTLVRLVKRKDVDALINACDAGREGELIFRRIVEYTKAKQPVQRLWLQSMTPAAIRDGFARTRSDEEMRPLAHAAESRAEADWLVGINGTRAMTAFNSKSGGFYKTTVGRVQTPTLAIVVEREASIRAFKPRDYWEVTGVFGAQAGEYPGRWFDENFKKPEGKDADPDLKPERLWDQAKAAAIKAKCLGKPGIVTEESKPVTQLSPPLYDLTSLQREANARFGFSAKNTLAIAQALYEKHKALTYPRTDSRHLPEDYIGTVRETLDALRGMTEYGGFAGKILANDWARPNKRVFNNAKVSDHFAIIPTGVTPKHLAEPEQKLFDLVTKRFLAVFYPAAEFLETIRITRVEGEPFKSTGKVLVKTGWLEVYGREARSGDDAPPLAPVAMQERVATRAIEVKAAQTRPPARFTEAALLAAMEGAGKLVDDEELRDAMSERGLGTPATRAAIIEGLIDEDYMHRAGRDLAATAKAFALMQLLDGLGVSELTKPEMTGDWEYQLKRMERGQLSRDQFMGEIRRLTGEIVRKAKLYDKDTIPGDFGALNTRCPKCGGEVHEKFREFKCLACDFSVRRVMGGRMFEEEEMEILIRDKQIGPLQGFRSQKGLPFAAVVRLNERHEAKFDFGNDSKDGRADEAADFSGKEPIGKCPKCGARVFENGMNYVCEKAAGPERTCDFKTGALILQQPVEKAQAAKLLAEGRTDLLRNFVSNKTGRKFEAFLVLKDGKVGFEFAPRERKFPANKKEKAGEPAQKIDFTGLEPLGKCPKCGGSVFEGPASYVCERSQADTKRCAFKSGKVVLQQPVDCEQFKKLLATGRTDVLEKFISRAGRPFPAFLKLGAKGRVEFEFPER